MGMSILQESEAEYKSAIQKLEAFAPKFFEFNQEVKKMLDKGDAIRDKWISETRAGTYGGTATGTVLCILADVFGTFAKGGVEAAIAKYDAQLGDVQKAGDEINLRIKELEFSMKEAIDFLETEVTIIIVWQEDVESVQDTISQFNAQELSVLKNVFIEDIDDLQASAQAFLDRPDNVFGS